MKTKTLRAARKSRAGLLLRFAMAAVIIAAASWYALPNLRDLSTEPPPLNRTLITTDDVNLRTGPGLNHDVILVVPTGTEVASDYRIEHGFTRVRVDDTQGWMSATYPQAPERDREARIASQSVPVEDLGVASSQPQVPQAPITADQAPEPQPTTAPSYEPVAAQTTQVQRDPQPGEKWIEVDRTNRTVTLHNGEIVVAQFDALIGKDLSADGYYSTATGTFHVHVKEKSLVETPFAEGVYLTDFVGFDPDRSNGFHSPVRDQLGNVVQTGGTSTLGCVRLAEDDAIFLFNFAHIGMRVEVHD